jgi:hypothetical protein
MVGPGIRVPRPARRTNLGMAPTDRHDDPATTRISWSTSQAPRLPSWPIARQESVQIMRRRQARNRANSAQRQGERRRTSAEVGIIRKLDREGSPIIAEVISDRWLRACLLLGNPVTGTAPIRAHEHKRRSARGVRARAARNRPTSRPAAIRARRTRAMSGHGCP